MRANVAQVQAYLSESTDIIYHFPEHTHNVCMLQLSTRTHKHIHILADYTYAYTLKLYSSSHLFTTRNSWGVVQTSIYVQ